MEIIVGKLYISADDLVLVTSLSDHDGYVVATVIKSFVSSDRDFIPEGTYFNMLQEGFLRLYSMHIDMDKEINDL